MKPEKNALLFNDLKFFLKNFFKQHHLIRPTLLVGYSGGLDSSVLLHVLHALQNELPFYLSAMHVHHGLSQHAGDWAAFCEQTCTALGVPIELHQVYVDADSGLGVEATARKARYQALNVAPADFICLGHHQDDQAETLLLQLARGAGVKGLAGMAQVDLGRRLLRPFLQTSRAELMAYAEQQQLKWIDDESNTDIAFDRNFMRHMLLPTFRERYASITKTLARSASHMAEASEMLDALAALDAAQVLDKTPRHGALQLTLFAKLSQARQGNLVRFWLAASQVNLPSAALLAQILQQLQTEKPDAMVKVKVADNLHVMRYKGLAYLVDAPIDISAINLLWQGEAQITLSNGSRLSFIKQKGKGLAYQRGGHNIKLRIKTREGGEYFRPALNRPRRRLKDIMQSCDIPPWQREQLPLIFMDEKLVIIPNVGVDADMQAESHEMGLAVRWELSAEE